jgi:hypothetical protein
VFITFILYLINQKNQSILLLFLFLITSGFKNYQKQPEINSFLALIIYNDVYNKVIYSLKSLIRCKLYL